MSTHENLPVSSDCSQNSMVSHSPFSNFEVNQAEQEMIDEIGDNDDDIHHFFDENAALYNRAAGDDTAWY